MLSVTNLDSLVW